MERISFVYVVFSFSQSILLLLMFTIFTSSDLFCKTSQSLYSSGLFLHFLFAWIALTFIVAGVLQLMSLSMPI